MKVGIFGYGRIGRAVHSLLKQRAPHIEVVWTHDISDGFTRIDGADVLVNTAPYTANREAIETALVLGAAYIDFSEDTAFWRDIVRDYEGLADYGRPIVPHCGIAPGIINIIAADFIDRGNRDVAMYCGALPARPPRGPLRHAVTWSAEGMAREYVEPSEVLVAGTYNGALPLTRSYEPVRIADMTFEAATTAGGAGSMPRTYDDGTGKTVIYRTLRWPGHWDVIEPWTKHPEVIKSMLAAAPKTDEDMVVVMVRGEGGPHSRWYQNVIRPSFGLSAIELATASGGCAVLDLIERELLPPGLNKQEEITLDAIKESVFGDVFADG